MRKQQELQLEEAGEEEATTTTMSWQHCCRRSLKSQRQRRKNLKRSRPSLESRQVQSSGLQLGSRDPIEMPAQCQQFGAVLLLINYKQILSLCGQVCGGMCNTAHVPQLWTVVQHCCYSC